MSGNAPSGGFAWNFFVGDLEGFELGGIRNIGME